MVCVTAPAVRVAIGEELGLGPGTVTTGQMVQAQRRLGFDFVFDVNFAGGLWWWWCGDGWGRVGLGGSGRGGG